MMNIKKLQKFSRSDAVVFPSEENTAWHSASFAGKACRRQLLSRWELGPAEGQVQAAKV